MKCPNCGSECTHAISFFVLEKHNPRREVGRFRSREVKGFCCSVCMRWWPV